MPLKRMQDGKRGRTGLGALRVVVLTMPLLSFVDTQCGQSGAVLATIYGGIEKRWLLWFFAVFFSSFMQCRHMVKPRVLGFVNCTWSWKGTLAYGTQGRGSGVADDAYHAFYPGSGAFCRAAIDHNWFVRFNVAAQTKHG